MLVGFFFICVRVCSEGMNEWVWFGSTTYLCIKFLISDINLSTCTVGNVDCMCMYVHLHVHDSMMYGWKC